MKYQLRLVDIFLNIQQRLLSASSSKGVKCGQLVADALDLLMDITSLESTFTCSMDKFSVRFK